MRRTGASISLLNVRTVTATRYVTPLREGGSLPAIVEADDSGLYVVKFRGAGHGLNALLAECISGELARVAGLRVPELVTVHIDPALGRNEPDAEIRALLKASAGLNLGLDWLPGSLTFDPVAGPAPSVAEASAIVWFDAFVSNPDRSPRNPNLLCWHRQLWLIDHGAALYFHHADDVFGYVIPRSKDCVLGGTAERGNDSLAVDPRTSQEILARCREREPRIEERILSATVGLRPGRSEIRLERERLPDGRALVHDYGHGGCGVTLSWACAEDAAALVAEVLD